MKKLGKKEILQQFVEPYLKEIQQEAVDLLATKPDVVQVQPLWFSGAGPRQLTTKTGMTISFPMNAGWQREITAEEKAKYTHTDTCGITILRLQVRLNKDGSLASRKVVFDDKEMDPWCLGSLKPYCKSSPQRIAIIVWQNMK